MKNDNIPIKIKIDVLCLNPDSMASGSRSRNAAPRRAPAENDTIKNKAFFNNLGNKKRFPIRDIKLTIKTAIKILIKTRGILVVRSTDNI